MAESEKFFERTPADFQWNDYYNHPNEPCHHIAFLFPYAGAPWHSEIAAGGVLEFEMGPAPNKEWGTESPPNGIKTVAASIGK